MKISHPSLENKVLQLKWRTSSNLWKLSADYRATNLLAGPRVHQAFVYPLLSLPFLMSFCVGAAEIVAVGGNTEVIKAPNNVTVININTPNASGLSHNKYIKYNVSAKGLVLNNLNPAKLEAMSKLAGKLTSNLNLRTGQSAKVILNEVVAPNRTKLEGFTEVFGAKADVIIANPYGITCLGCGFINTDNVTLTTGTSKTTAAGELSGFAVRQGDVLISGAGLNAEPQEVLNIVARKVKLEGRLNAKDLVISVGAQDWQQNTRTSTAAAVTDSAPLIGLDATALGGMYAQSIKLIANEQGVGVRMMGDSVASGSDFYIDAKGNIVIGSKISAQRDLIINGASPSAKVELIESSSLAAKRNIKLETVGRLTIKAASINAENDLVIKALSLTDHSSAVRFSGNDTLVRVQDAIFLSGSTWGAGNNIELVSGSFTSDAIKDVTIYAGGDASKLGKSISIEATYSDIKLNGMQLTATKDIVLNAQQGAISNSVSSNKIQAGGNLKLNAKTSITNRRKLEATQHIIVRSNNDSNTLLFNNLSAAIIQAGQNIEIAGYGDNDHKINFFNKSDAQLLAGNNLVIHANDLENLGTLQASKDLQISLSNNFSNKGTALSKEGKLTVSQAQNIDNSGVIQSATSIELNATNSINNSKKIQTLSATNGDIKIVGSTINVGSIISSAALTVIGKLQNSKLLQAKTQLNVQANEILNSVGALLKAEGDLVINSHSANFSLTNSGRIESGSDLHIGDSQHKVGLNNTATGVMQSNKLQLSAEIIDNHGRIQAVKNSQISAQTLNMKGSSSVLLTSTEAGQPLSRITVVGAVTNQGAIHGNSALELKAASLVNTGGISSLADLAITTSGDITNRGALYSASQLKLTSNAAIYNKVSGTMHSDSEITISSSVFSNNGEVLAGDKIDITTRSQFINRTVLANGVIFNVQQSAPQNINRLSSLPILEETSTLHGSDIDLYTEQYYTVDSIDTAAAEAFAAQQKAQIIVNGSAGQININYGAGSGENNLAVLSANNIKVSGSGTFTNKDLSLYKKHYIGQWIQVTDKYVTLSSSFPYAPTTKTAYAYWGRNTPNADYVHGSDITNANNEYNDYKPGSGWTQFSSKSAAKQHSLHPDRATLARVEVIKNYKSGIFADNFTFNGGTFVNQGSPHASNVQDAKQSRSAATNTIGALSESAVSGSAAQAIQKSNTLNFPGLTINLPTNPNGYYVVSKSNTAKYLIESNPLFDLKSTFVGSNYMAKRYGVNPDTLVKRLGDAHYEAYLIRQQLINKTGRNIIDLGQNEADQLRNLMNNGADQGRGLGLVYGRELTSQQVAKLQKNIVWMVEKLVKGQKVLVPVVYLSKASRAMISNGATVAANNSTFTGESFKNVGGSISGKKELTINVRGDIENISGDISGGKVALKSREGSIINRTFVKTSGKGMADIGSSEQQKKKAMGEGQGKIGNGLQRTVIGKTSTIRSTGTLALEAEKDIKIVGAKLSSGKGASIKTHTGDVIISTIVKKITKSSVSDVGSGLNKRKKTTVISTETHTGSTLDIGGDLAIDSGGSIIKTNVDLSTGGNFDETAKGSIKTLAVQDKTRTKTFETKSAFDQGLDTVTKPIAEGARWSKQAVKDSANQVSKTAKSVADASGATAAANWTATVAKDTANLTATVTKSAANWTAKAAKDSADATGATAAANWTATAAKDTVNAVEEGASQTANAVKNTAVKGANWTAKAAQDTADATGATAAANWTASAVAKTANQVADVAKKGANWTAKAAQDSADATGVTAAASWTAKAATDTVNTVKDGANQAASGVKKAASWTAKAATDTADATGASSALKWTAKAAKDTADATGATAVANWTATAASDTVGFAKTATGKTAKWKRENLKSERTETDTFVGKNQGSSLKIGGNMTSTAGGSFVVQGSDIKVKGSGEIKAKQGIKILDGFDEKRSVSKKVTREIGKIVSKGDAEAGVKSKAEREGLSAASGASANAKASGSSSMEIYNETVETREKGEKRSVSSTLSFGKNLTMVAGEEGDRKDITVKGSNIETGGNLSLVAKDVKILAGETETWDKTSTKSTGLGIYTEAEAEAKAGVGAEAKFAGAKLNDSKAGAKAETGVEAKALVDRGLRMTTTNITKYSKTNRGSQIKAGGNVAISADTTTYVGAKVTVQGDYSNTSRIEKTLAAKDIKTETSSTTSNTIGAYISLEAGAGAEAKAEAEMTGGGAEASAEAKADIESGIRVTTRSESSRSGSSTSKVSTFKVGGNVKRKVADTITDEGTNWTVGGDYEQSAKNINFKAARDTSYKETKSASAELRVGVGAGAIAGASAEGGSEVGAGAGGRIHFKGEMKAGTESASKAVVGNINVAGGFKSSASDKTSMEGTKLKSGKNIDISSESFTYKAAKDTKSTTEKELSGSMDAKLEIDAKSVVGGELKASISAKTASSDESTAVAGTMQAGGNLNIQTTGDASFEGSKLSAKGKTTVNAGGQVTFKAARNTSQSSEISGKLSAGASTSGAVEASIKGKISKASSSEAVVAEISSGQGGTDITSRQGDIKLEGTKLKSAGATSLTATEGNVELRAAKSTVNKIALEIELGTKSEKGDEGKREGENEMGASFEFTDKITSASTQINSAKGIKITAKKVLRQEDKTTGKLIIVADEVENIKAEQRDIDISIGAKFKKEFGKGDSGDSATEQKPKSDNGAKQGAKSDKSAVSKPKAESAAKQEAKSDKSAASKPKAESAAKQEAKSDKSAASKSKSESAVKQEAKSDKSAASKSKSESAVKQETESDKSDASKSKAESAAKQEAKSDKSAASKPKAESAAKQEAKSDKSATSKPKAESAAKQEAKSDKSAASKSKSESAVKQETESDKSDASKSKAESAGKEKAESDKSDASKSKLVVVEGEDSASEMKDGGISILGEEEEEEEEASN